MVFAPIEPTQFQPLLDSIKIKHNKDVEVCISGHFHEDRITGLELFKQKGINRFLQNE